MAIAFRNSSILVSGAARTTSTINLPAGTVAGDEVRLLLNIGHSSATPPTAPGMPANVSLIASVTIEFGGYSLRHSAYRYRATGSDPSSFAFTHQSTTTDGAALSYSGVDATTPDDATATTSSGTTATNASTTSLTTVTADTLLVASRVSWDGNAITPPGGYTERWDQPISWGGDSPKAATGATGVVAIPSGNAGTFPYLTIMQALRPAAGGPGQVTSSLATTWNVKSQTSSRVAVTTGAPGAATAFSPTLPTHIAGDRLILAVVGKDQTTTIPTINQGWTLVKSGTGGTGSTTADNGQTFYAIYAKDATSGAETAPTVTPGGTAPNSWEWICTSHRLGDGMEWRDAIGASVAWVQAASDTTTGSPLTGTAAAWTGVQPTTADAIFAVGVIPTDLGTALGATTLTATGLSGGTKDTATSQYVENALGLDTAAVWAGWVGFTGTASAGLALSFTVTGATNQSGSLIAIALRQQAVVTTTPVSSSIATGWNVIGQASQTIAESWRVRQEITKVTAESWMTEFLVSQNVAQAWNVKQAITKTTAEAWNLQSRTTSSSVQAWNIRQAITGLSVQAWAVKQAITKTTAETWNLRAFTTNTLAELWNVGEIGITLVTASYIASWNTRAATSQNVAQSWRVCTTVTQSLAESWPVEILASQTVAESWRLRQAPTSSTAQQWVVKATASQTAVESWRVRQALTSNMVQAWHTRNVVTSGNSQAWAVKTSLSKTIAESWKVRQAITAEIGAYGDIYGDTYGAGVSWNVGGLLTTVTSTKALSWKVVGRITPTLAQQWNVRTTLSQTVAQSWRVRGVLSQTVAESWRVRQAITPTTAQQWVVKATASQIVAESWQVRQAITRSYVALWNTIATGQVSKSQATAWHVRAQTTSPTAQQWAVKTTISKTTAETWRVAITTSKIVAELWNVLALAAVTSSRATSWKVRAYTSQTVDQAWNLRTTAAQSLPEAWNVRTLAITTRATSWKLRSQLTASRAVSWHLIGRITAYLALTWNTHPESFYPGGPWTLDATAQDHGLEIEPDSGLVAVGDWTVTMEA